MKKTRLILSMLALLNAGNTLAEDAMTVTINGQPVKENIQNIAFSGDNAIITFSNETTQTVDMDQLCVTFDYNGTADIQTVDAANANHQPIYTLDGRYAGNRAEHLGKGVYILNGKKILVK